MADKYILHYDGYAWNKIAEETKEGFYCDLAGTPDGRTVYCAKSYLPLMPAPKSPKFLKINNDNNIEEIECTSEIELFSAWTDNSFFLYTCGGWISQYKENRWIKFDFSAATIRGNAINDIIAAGEGGKIMHFNGMNWHVYDMLPGSKHYNYCISSISGNDMVLAGGSGGLEVVVTIGKRK